jgi:DNA topoisomerase-1
VGSVLAARALAGTDAFRSNAEARRRIAAAIETVARQLGNTRTVCRKSYVHPAILDAYMNGATMAVSRHGASCLPHRADLSAEETAVVRLIQDQIGSSRYVLV